MIDIRNFAVNLPSFIERSYYISPGVVSVIFKVIWSIFTFLVVTFFIQFGFAAAGIKKSETETEKNQKSLWDIHQDYSKVQSVSNGKWGGMLFNIPSMRVILGFLFWVFIYAFELLFSLSIDNTYITHYNGTACVGRINNFTTMADTMLDSSVGVMSVNPPQNTTLLRQLLNQNQVGNIVLLGDGKFAISPIDALYKKNQTINVVRTGFQCDYTVNLKKFDHGEVFYPPSPGSNISTPYFPNMDPSIFGTLAFGYVNLKVINNGQDGIQPVVEDNIIFLILVSNPVNGGIPDINQVIYNSTVFLQECILFYEHGFVTIAEDGYLNETNIGESYLKVNDNTAGAGFHGTSIDTSFILDTTFISLFDYPDIFVNRRYNYTYIETMKMANNIVAAHLLNGLDPNADLCTFNQEQVPVYFSVIGTRMSFGYILMGVAFVVISLSMLSVFAFAIFSREERSGWLLYSNDWRFTGYLSTGSNMDKKTFKEHTKNIYIKNSNSADVYQENEDDSLYSETLLKKK